MRKRTFPHDTHHRVHLGRAAEAVVRRFGRLTAASSAGGSVPEGWPRPFPDAARPIAHGLVGHPQRGLYDVLTIVAEVDDISLANCIYILPGRRASAGCICHGRLHWYATRSG